MPLACSSCPPATRPQAPTMPSLGLVSREQLASPRGPRIDRGKDRGPPKRISRARHPNRTDRVFRLSIGPDVRGRVHSPRPYGTLRCHPKAHRISGKRQRSRQAGDPGNQGGDTRRMGNPGGPRRAASFRPKAGQVEKCHQIQAIFDRSAGDRRFSSKRTLRFSSLAASPTVRCNRPDL